MTPIYRAYLYNQSAFYGLKLLWFGFLACGGGDFVDAFLAGFGSLGGDDPVEHHFFNGFAEAKEVFFCSFVLFEGLLQVVGDDEFFDLVEDGPRSVLFGDFDALISGGGHESGFVQFLHFVFIDFRPGAFGFSLAEELMGCLGVDFDPLAVDPSEAQRYVDGFAPGDGG